MKIVTVNVPETYIDAMEKLIGEDGLYPSRSELIRCATRDFLIKEGVWDHISLKASEKVRNI